MVAVMRKLTKAQRPMSLVSAAGVPIVPRQAVRWAIGARSGDKETGAHVYFRLGDEEHRLTPDEADEMAGALRNFSVEVRNGGALPSDDSA